MNLARNARNAVVADLALAFLRDRVAAQFPGVKPRRRGPNVRTLLIGGGVAAALAALLLGRGKVKALLPGGSPAAEPPPMPSGFAPVPATGPSNYDAGGPVTNTATAVPAPPAFDAPAIDEAAEEAAAAAEAANIGGEVSDYAAPSPDEPIAPEEVPLAEAGEGEAEGQEQAEAELAEAAEPSAPGQSPEQQQIEATIEDASNPAAGENVEPDRGAEWRTWSGRSIDP